MRATRIDSIDWQIINLLNDDGRMSSAEIARRIGAISARAVSNRIEKLRERGVFAIRAVVDPRVVGYGLSADVIVEVEPRHVRKVAEIAAQFELASYVAYDTGNCEVSIQVFARNTEELFVFAGDTIGEIPGVRRIRTHLMPVRLKDVDTWLPPGKALTEAASETGSLNGKDK